MDLEEMKRLRMEFDLAHLSPLERNFLALPKRTQTGIFKMLVVAGAKQFVNEGFDSGMSNFFYIVEVCMDHGWISEEEVESVLDSGIKLIDAHNANKCWQFVGAECELKRVALKLSQLKIPITVSRIRFLYEWN